MEYTEDEIKLIKIARETVRLAVSTGNVESLDATIHAFYKTGLSVLLIFNSTFDEKHGN